MKYDSDDLEFFKSMLAHHLDKPYAVEVIPQTFSIRVSSEDPGLTSGLVAYLFVIAAEDPQDMWDFCRGLKQLEINRYPPHPATHVPGSKQWPSVTITGAEQE